MGRVTYNSLLNIVYTVILIYLILLLNSNKVYRSQMKYISTTKNHPGSKKLNCRCSYPSKNWAETLLKINQLIIEQIYKKKEVMTPWERVAKLLSQ